MFAYVIVHVDPSDYNYRVGHVIVNGLGEALGDFVTMWMDDRDEKCYDEFYVMRDYNSNMSDEDIAKRYNLDEVSYY